MIGCKAREAGGLSLHVRDLGVGASKTRRTCFFLINDKHYLFLKVVLRFGSMMARRAVPQWWLEILEMGGFDWGVMGRVFCFMRRRLVDLCWCWSFGGFATD